VSEQSVFAWLLRATWAANMVLFAFVFGVALGWWP
jgi:hypothetical protein